MYSPQILTLLKHIYLAHRLDSSRYYLSESWPETNGNEVLFNMDPEMEPYYQIYSSVISKARVFPF